MNREMLTKLIDCYAEQKIEENRLKKENNTLNKNIKEGILSLNVSSVATNNFVAKYTIVKQESFDDDKLANVLKNIWKSNKPNPYLKVVYVPVMEAIENAIYNDEFTKEDLAEINKCKITKQIPKLTISKKKGEENEN